MRSGAIPTRFLSKEREILGGDQFWLKIVQLDTRDLPALADGELTVV